MKPLPQAETKRTGIVLPGSTARRRPPAKETSRQLPRTRPPAARKIARDILPGFSRKLAAMLSAGMPIVAALRALEKHMDHALFKNVVGAVIGGIERGLSLSESLAQFPSIFDSVYVNMVKGGEASGQLAEIVKRLAILLEGGARLRKRVKSAMVYPIVVLCISLGIAAAMVLFVVPVFSDMFSQFDSELPAPTQFLMNASEAVRNHWFLVLVCMTGSVVAFRRWQSTPRGAYLFDSFVLRVPVFGLLVQQVATARFARIYGQLVRGAVPILGALDIAGSATGNLAACRVIHNCRSTVEKGEPLSSALEAQTVFPGLLTEMIHAGENTGKVDEMMECIADFYEDEVNNLLEGLTSLLEPMLMVFLGAIIGGIVVCMFLPIFKMGPLVS